MDAEMIWVEVVEVGKDGVRIKRSHSPYVARLEEMVCPCDMPIPADLAAEQSVRVDLSGVDEFDGHYVATPATRVARFYPKK